MWWAVMGAALPLWTQVNHKLCNIGRPTKHSLLLAKLTNLSSE